MTDLDKGTIESRVKDINSASEKYQLIHAVYASEKIFQHKTQNDYNEEFNDIRQEIEETSDPDKLKVLLQKAKELQEGKCRKVRIILDYSPKLKYGSARISKIENRHFQISLSKEMENIRNNEGNVDFNKLQTLRKLTAHELGHVILHSGILDGKSFEDINLAPDDEAEFFAETLLRLREIHNKEMHPH